ncbi:MAG: hypothetical protein WBD34_23635 [Burkholderiaceae bacterium]
MKQANRRHGCRFPGEVTSAAGWQYHLFRYGRHLHQAKNHRMVRDRAI